MRPRMRRKEDEECKRLSYNKLASMVYDLTLRAVVMQGIESPRGCRRDKRRGHDAVSRDAGAGDCRRRRLAAGPSSSSSASSMMRIGDTALTPDVGIATDGAEYAVVGAGVGTGGAVPYEVAGDCIACWF